MICVNYALRTCPVKPFAFATLHPEKGRRFLEGIDYTALPLFSSEANSNDRFPWRVEKEFWRGTSGLFAVQVAIKTLGFAGVIVAGVPIDHVAGTTYKLEPRYAGKWANGYEDRYRSGWRLALPHIKDRVRSMSGWTKELLGAPSKQWIEALTSPALRT